MMQGPTCRSTFVVTKQHFASIFTPHVTPNGTERYAIRCPADDFPGCEGRDRVEDSLGPMVNAGSKYRPVFVPGSGLEEEWRQWDELAALAGRWNYPTNSLLLGREITVIGSTWYAQPTHLRPRGGTYASVLAVSVGGDFSYDSGLVDHIETVRGWFV